MLFPVPSLSTNKQSQHIVDRVSVRARNAVSPLAEYANPSGVVSYRISALGEPTLVSGTKLYLGTNCYMNSNSQYEWAVSTGYGTNSIYFSQSTLQCNSFAVTGGTYWIGGSSFGSKIALTEGSALSGGGPQSVCLCPTYGGTYNNNGNQSGDIILSGQAGGAAASGNTNGGKASAIIVRLRAGGAPSGTGVAGADGYFELNDGSSQLFKFTRSGVAELSSSVGVTWGRSTDKQAWWGSTPVTQQVLATGASKTVDDVITLLQTLGLCKQS